MTGLNIGWQHKYGAINTRELLFQYQILMLETVNKFLMCPTAVLVHQCFDYPTLTYDHILNYTGYLRLAICLFE